LAWRRQNPALRADGIRFIDAPDSALAFVQERGKERVLVAFNLSGDPASIPIPSNVTPLTGHGFPAALSQRKIKLPPFGAFFGRLETDSVARARVKIVMKLPRVW
jgi:alpha-glucosidase